MISIQNLGVEFSAKPLFHGVSFVINKNDRIALTGKNGAGKSTMLKIIAGLQHPDSGSVSVPNDVTIGYLPQQMQLSDDSTLIEETRKAFAERRALQQQLEQVNSRLESLTADADPEECARLLEQAQHLNDRLDMDRSEQMEGEIEKTLMGLGFARSDLNRATSEFSGGWRMRIELAKILLRRPQLMLLDEPTNHLDIESIQWLENFLREKAGAVVLVSHDKTFIDNVTTRTIEINCGTIQDYRVSYTQYLELRRERLEQQRRAYDNQQKQIAEIKDFIERFRYKPTKSNQVQSRIKMLEKIVPVEIDEVDNSRLRLKFPPSPRSGDYPLIIDGVTKSYGAHTVFSDATLTLKRGQKVAFVGKNGQGKTTLVKCIMGQTDYSGDLRIGHNVKIGYFAQNQAQLLDGDLTVFDTIDSVATGDMRLRVRDILGAFMFGGEAADKPVKVLSGGEKTRLAMIRLLLEPVNLLILDEPTNHLDIASKQVLKEAVKSFDGTAIIVSHDRDFLDGLVDKVYEFADGRMREEQGGIEAFLTRLRGMDIGVAMTQMQTAPNVAPAMTSKKEVASASVAEQKSQKLDYAMQKEHARILRKARKDVENAEAEIARLEEEQKRMEQRLSAGDVDAQLLSDYEANSKRLDNAMSIWELASAELDRLTDN